MSGNFPDILFITPDDQNIKIEQIRNLNRHFGFKPVSGRFRVSIIHRAETMTEEAANSFLKILEEPPQGNILILNVTEPLDLLPTIVSRCQKVPFLPISTRLIADWIKEKKNMDEEKALVLAKISEGSLGRAINMCESDFIERREDYLFRIIQLPTLPAEQALEMVLELTERVKKKNLDESKEGGGDIFMLLGIWKTWYRDLLLMKVKGPEDLLINIDFSRRLKNISKNYKIDNLMNSFLVLNQAQKDLIRARNLDMMMENTVLSLKRLTS
jgi:DNA polymerase-3 subunit delta'